MWLFLWRMTSIGHTRNKTQAHFILLLIQASIVEWDDHITHKIQWYYLSQICALLTVLVGGVGCVCVHMHIRIQSLSSNSRKPLKYDIFYISRYVETIVAPIQSTGDMILPENNRTCKTILAKAFSDGFLRRLETLTETGPETGKEDSKEVPDPRWT